MSEKPVVRRSSVARVEPLENRQLLSAVTGFTLINSQTDQPVPGFNSIDNGDTINLANLPAGKLNVRANTDNLGVKSVKLGLDNNANFAIENVSPYALFGNTGNDFNDGTFAVGTHTLKGTPFSLSGAKGTAGTSRTVTFNVINQPTTPPPPVPAPQVTQFLLIDADTDQVIEPIDAGDEFNLATLPTRNLNIEVKTSGQAGSVRIKLDDVQKVENFSPWAYFGNTGSDFNAGSLNVGGHVLAATAFSGTNARGRAGANQAVNFTVIDTPVPPQNPTTGPRVTGLTLINRDLYSNTPGLFEIGPLGSSLDLGSIATRTINVRAETDGAIGSIRFTIDGSAYSNVVNPVDDPNDTTNDLRFYLFEDRFGNEGAGTTVPADPNVPPALFTPGPHTITATVFSEANGGGTAGGTSTFSVLVSDSDIDPEDDLRFYIDTDDDGSFADEAALGDQDAGLPTFTGETFAARFVNVGDTPILLDAELVLDVDNAGNGEIGLGFISLPGSGDGVEITPPPDAERRTIQSNTHAFLIGTLRITEGSTDPGVFAKGTATYEFRSPTNSDVPKTLQPGEGLDFQITTQANGSLKSGSGSPSKKGKPRRF